MERLTSIAPVRGLILSARSFDEFRNSLRIGQLVSGRVLRIMSDQNVIIRLGGFNVVARAETPLRRGERVAAVVRALEPLVHLKLAASPMQETSPVNYIAALRDLGLDIEPLNLALIEQMLRYRIPPRKRTLTRLRSMLEAFMEENEEQSSARLSEAMVLLLSFDMPVDRENLALGLAALRAPEEPSIDFTV
jgi:hypothetical protein